MNKGFRTFALLAFLLFSFATLHAALSGAYTIGAGPASATNYGNFASAASDLNSGVRSDGGPVNGPGVSGPVVFTISAGTYSEQFSLNAITGASAVNTITFDGVDPLTRIISRNSTTSGDYTIRLNGADFIRIQNLGIDNPGVTYGFGVQLIAGADNNIISGCRVTLPVTATGSGKVGIIGSTSYTALGLFTSGLSLLNNTVIGGYVGIAINGPSGTQAIGLTMNNNTITDAYYSGFYIQYIIQLTAIGNTVTMRNNYASSYGGNLRYCSEFDFSRNKITNMGLYGVYLLGSNFNVSNPSNFNNNMIGGSFQTTGTGYGIYASTNRFTNIFHNSVLVDNPGTGSRAIYILGTNQDLDVRNNSFATTLPGAASYAIYVSTTTGLLNCDYNNYYTAGSNLAYFLGNYATLAALQTAYPAYNQNCQAAWPNYLSSTDLHTWGAPLSNWATNIVAVTNDYDNQTRPLAPDLIKDVGADEFVVPPVDADVAQLVGPVVPVVGANSVQVMLQNNGSGSLNGTPITLQYSTDGGVSWPVTQTFTPTTLGGLGQQETFTFSTPWVIAAQGSYTYCVRINPLVVGDPDASDQLCSSVCTGMSGTYTVDGGFATGGTNFNNFYDLVTALSGCGIAGPVVVNVAPGVYNQTFTIGHINGTSAVNTVLIDGGDTSLVTIQASINTANGSVITLDSADYVTFRGIKINSVGVTYGNCIKLTNGANYITVDSCALMMPTNNSSVYHIGLIASGATYTTYGDHANYVTLSNSVVKGGYYGVRLNGTSTTIYCTGNRILNNQITEYYYYGIYTYYQSAPEYIRNTIICRTTGIFTTFGYGIYAYYAQGSFKIEDNVIHSVGSYGIYLGYGNNDNTGKGRIINNMIGGNFQTTSTGYGVYMTQCRDIDFYHNSIEMGGISGYGMYITGSPPSTDSLRIVNNIISGGGTFPGQGSRIMYVANPGSIQTINYNLYYSLYSQFVLWGGITYVSLADWQTNVPSQNQNSVQDNPGFISNINLHVVCSPSDNLGTPLGILQDIDKQSRSTTTPDVGADEFTAITVTTSLGPDTAYCGSRIIYGDTINFQQFIWNGSQFQPFLQIDSTGTYSVYAIDSNNCRASDTVVIVIDSLPQVIYDGDTLTVCNTTTLDAQNAGSNYLWSNGAVTQTTTPATAGLYYVTVTTTAGCSLTDSVHVILHPNPVVDLGNDTTFCLGAGGILDAGAGPTGTTYQWSTGATTQVVVITSPGQYFVTVTSQYGCVSGDSVTLNILQSPVPNLPPNHTACGPEVLDAGNPGNTFAWSTGANSQTINVTASGTYSVTVTNSLGCSTVDQTTITMGASPTVNLGPDQLLCGGQTATLDAGNPGSTYLWSSGANTQTIMVGTTGTYFVSVTAPNGCIGTDTITITQSSLIVNLGANTNICDNGFHTLNAGNPGSTYAWSTGANTQLITVTQPGTYSVTVTDQLGCTAGDNIILSQVPGVTASIGAPATANLFFPIQFNDLSTGSVTTWEWDFGDGSPTSNAQNPVHSFGALGVFTVTLIITDGFCRDTTTTVVDVNQFVNMEDGSSFAAALEVYPNPSTGLFHLYLELYKRGDVALQVMDLGGRMLYQDVLRSAVSYQGDIDLGHLSKGVYVLALESGGQKIYRKLVIQ
jgi:trimeric autotransporter adhesin